MTHFISEAVGCSNEDVQAMVLGGHGDTMVPLPRYTTINGIPIKQLLDAETIKAICGRTAGGVGRSSSCLRRGVLSMHRGAPLLSWSNQSWTTGVVCYLAARSSQASTGWMTSISGFQSFLGRMGLRKSSNWSWRIRRLPASNNPDLSTRSS